MKKFLVFVIIANCHLFVANCCFSQWNTIIDNNNKYINGSPVYALHYNASINRLIIGGKINLLGDTVSGLDCCGMNLYLWDNWIFDDVYDCAPLTFINGGPDSSSIFALASVYDPTWLGKNLSVGGRFTGEGCMLPGAPDYFHNLNFYNYAGADFSPPSEMDCSDTVFAIAMVDNEDCPALVTGFKTYVAGRCVFCNCQDSLSIDSSRYIAFYDPYPYPGCNFNLTPNYMQGGTNGPVYTIQAIDTANVYAGGKFDSTGVIKANNIAKWNGASWDSLGSGVNGTVKALLAYNGKLYAGGNFTMAGGMPANNIAVWDGTNWSSLGTGTNGTVKALAIHNGNLYAGGAFTQAGGNTVNNVARWNGVNWSALDGGRNNEVYALASYQGDLYAGGNFTGGANDTARYFAMYIDSLTAVSQISNLSSQISIYPNPTSGKFTLNSKITEGEITIYNIQGERIYATTLNSKQETINLSSQFSGIYFLHIKTPDGVAVKKLVKQ